MNIENAFKDGELKELMLKAQQSNWANTYFKHYVGMSTKNKGVLGEAFVEKLFLAEGFEVLPPTNPGHDRIIGGHKTEIKFSLANSPLNKKLDKRLIVPDQFTYNHIACDKDWHRFIFCGVNPAPSHDPSKVLAHPKNRALSQLRLYFMEKSDFIQYMSTQNTDLFSRQQGGEKGGNDDYMLAGMNKFYRLISLPFVKEVEGNW
tara:strand:- start:413 stop:1024 length:612 start_codon:yes stop_codon:yes gene_type:complete